MKLITFLRQQTKVHELCVIRDCGYITTTAWIDNEDLFRIPVQYQECKVLKDAWGILTVTDKDNRTVKVPCHYIDINYSIKEN